MDARRATASRLQEGCWETLEGDSQGEAHRLVKKEKANIRILDRKVQGESETFRAFRKKKTLEEKESKAETFEGGGVSIRRDEENVMPH